MQRDAAAVVAGVGEPEVRTRSATRFAVRLPVRMQLAGGCVRGTTRNLSLGGVLVEAPLALACRTRLVVFLALPGASEELVLDAVVRRVEPDAIALRFERLGSRNVWSLGDFLERL
jgi:hypothetical protein